MARSFPRLSLVVMIGSGLILAGILRLFTQRSVLDFARDFSRLLRRWHSGLGGDYALWNEFGTAVILIALLLAERLGR